MVFQLPDFRNVFAGCKITQDFITRKLYFTSFKVIDLIIKFRLECCLLSPCCFLPEKLVPQMIIHLVRCMARDATVWGNPQANHFPDILIFPNGRDIAMEALANKYNSTFPYHIYGLTFKRRSIRYDLWQQNTKRRIQKLMYNVTI